MDTEHCFRPRGYKCEQDRQVFSLKEHMILTVQQDGSGDDTSMKRHEMEICSWSDKLSDGIQRSSPNPQK